jgi:hypothetical protein
MVFLNVPFTKIGMVHYASPVWFRCHSQMQIDVDMYKKSLATLESHHFLWPKDMRFFQFFQHLILV